MRKSRWYAHSHESERSLVLAAATEQVTEHGCQLGQLGDRLPLKQERESAPEKLVGHARAFLLFLGAAFDGERRSLVKVVAGAN